MGARKQSNVGFSPEDAEKIEVLARIFHEGKFGTAVRMLALEGLRHVHTKEDYLALLEKCAEEGKARDNAPVLTKRMHAELTGLIEAEKLNQRGSRRG